MRSLVGEWTEGSALPMVLAVQGDCAAASGAAKTLQPSDITTPSHTLSHRRQKLQPALTEPTTATLKMLTTY
jgi:hypothetical protein